MKEGLGKHGLEPKDGKTSLVMKWGKPARQKRAAGKAVARATTAISDAGGTVAA